MSRRSFALASAAAALFVAGAALPAAADEAEVKCEGVNACKGQSACSTAQNECAGQNGCKGKGFLMLTPEECEAAKAQLKQEPAEPEQN
jgi:hypothetical protein